MRPVLLRVGSYSIASYSFFVAIAVILAVVTLAFRSRRRDLDQFALVFAAGLGLFAGWLGGRILPVLWSDGLAKFEWTMFLPTRPYGQSLSGFLIAAFPVACVCLWGSRRRILAYLDVICPSLLLGLAIAKIACLLAGCCAGRPCPPRWGVHYPYGSEVFVSQWRGRLLTAPASLIRVGPEGAASLLGHAQFLELYQDQTPRFLQEQADHHALSYATIIAAVKPQRSLPVHAVPLWYVIAAGLLWVATEWLYRRSSIAGLTAGITFLSYGLLRLLFDQHVSSMGRAAFRLTETQISAFPIIAIGAAMLLYCRKQRPVG